MSQQHTLELSFREDSSLIEADDGSIIIQAPEGNHMGFKQPAPGFTTVLKKLASGRATEKQLANLVMEQDGSTALIPFYQYMIAFSERSLLSYTIRVGDSPLATIQPIVRHYRYQANLVNEQQAYVLSRFAYCHKVDDYMVLETPLGYARIILYDWRVSGIVHTLSQPQCCEALVKSSGLLKESVNSFLNFLLNAQTLNTVEENDTTIEETSPELAQWDFHDLLFHSRSRLGRHNNPYGGTFRSKGKFEPLPMVKPDMSEEVIPLYKPDLESLKQNERPFTAVLEERRSIREYAEQPITDKELGEFLYRTARIKHVIQSPEGEMDYSLRPHPGGGAIHELEIYPLIGQCENIQPGLYHYNPLKHQLYKISDKNEYIDRLLYTAWLTADKRSNPQVYLGLTARFQRVQWKYESMVYALHLKHVGVLYQTMYLVATAMGLAPCALGGGNSDLFGRAAGLDYYAESLVGEFLLGSKGSSEHVNGRK